MPKKNREKLSQPPEKAKGIFEIVRMLPANTKFEDCYSIYGMQLDYYFQQHQDLKLLAIRYDFEYETQFRDERIDWRLFESLDVNDERVVFVNSRILGRCLIEALEICLQKMPARFVEYVELPKWRDEYLYRLARESGFCFRHKITSLKSFIEFSKKERIVADLLYFGYGACRAYERYSSVPELYQRLYNLAKIAVSNNSTDLLDRSEMDNSLYVFDEVRVKIVNGRFEFESDEFTTAFRGVPVDRIRLCEKCGRVFWVNRTGMRGCTKECISVLSTRKWRETKTKSWKEKTTPEQRQQYKINRIIKGEKE